MHFLSNSKYVSIFDLQKIQATKQSTQEKFLFIKVDNKQYNCDGYLHDASKKSQVKQILSQA